MNIRQITRLLVNCGFLAITLLSGYTMNGQDDEKAILDLGEFEVIGSKESVFEIPASGFFLSQNEMSNFQYANIDQILRQVPGVYFRGEDGYGLFPNISLRGVDSNRSGKLTMMEDGVLTAPAPYAAPSAYYSPTAGRMSSFEVLKGSSQIQYGPHTTGGVINYISTPIPDGKAGFTKLQYGEDNDMRIHTWYGDKVETGSGVLGYLVELYARETDGFKTIDSTEAYEGSDETGFDKTDSMIKFGYQPNTSQYHYFEIKLGYTDFHANETYLGLSTEDFRENPYRRYAASRFDEMNAHQTRSYLRHLTRWDSGAKLTTTAYYNNFHRNWYKLQAVNGSSLGTALFNGTDDYQTLTGTRAGELRVRANNRKYYLGGIQSEFNQQFYQGEVSHNVTVGGRFHSDNIRRFQWEDIYNMNDEGGVDEYIQYGHKGPGEAGNRKQTVDATSLYVMDEISVGKWAVTPGLRYEYVDWYYWRADGKVTPDEDSGNFDVFAPGINVSYKLSDETRLFAGANRGISTLSPSSARKGLEVEEANSYEAGVKHNDRDGGWYGEAVLFQTDFENLIARESDGGGNPVGGDKNIGKITTRGLELLFSKTLYDGDSNGIHVPLTFAFTWTDAEFVEGTASGNADSTIFAGAQPGNELPYIPEFQWNLTLGLDAERWSANVAASYVGESFADGSNLGLEEDTSGDPDSRFGMIDEYFTVDLGFRYKISKSATFFASIQNVFGEEWLASRIPHGPRPGAPRQASLGFEFNY